MAKPTIILATSNGIGLGHLARATAIAEELKAVANPVIVSVAGGIAELSASTGIPCEYIPGKTRGWMPRRKWDNYLRDRLLAIAEETGASLISFDGVVPYPGFISTKILNPDVKLVWVRRGLWQRNALRFALPFQSRLVDYVIEPGDFARAYDHGPTSRRDDAYLSSPVSLYKKSEALNRIDSRKELGLDLNRPAVLVQLGTGDSDMNQNMTAALEGLRGWSDLQIVLTKEPKDKFGNTLIPEGLSVKVVRYFPLSRVLKAFDGAIAATGYNSVHELLPAAIPTVFISNIRGTDDQDARAKWCHDFGYALRASFDSPSSITSTVRQLQDSEVRQMLSEKCSQLPITSGASEIAEALFKHATSHGRRESLLKRMIRVAIVQSLLIGVIAYRKVRPQKFDVEVSQEAPLFSESTDTEFLRSAIKGNRRFEQLIPGASEKYRLMREAIARRVYS